MICSSCGKELNGEDEFCTYCGAKTAIESQEYKDQEIISCNKYTLKKCIRKRIRLKKQYKITLFVAMVLLCFLVFVFIVNKKVNEELNDTVPFLLTVFYHSDIDYDLDSETSLFVRARDTVEEMGWCKIFLFSKNKVQLEKYEEYFDSFPYDKVRKKFIQCDAAIEAQEDYEKVVEKIGGIVKGEVPFSERDFLLQSYYKAREECRKTLAVVLECDESCINIVHSETVLKMEAVTSESQFEHSYISYPNDAYHGVGGADYDTVNDIYDLFLVNEGISARNIKRAVLYEETYENFDWFYGISDEFIEKYGASWIDEVDDDRNNAYGYYNYK